MGNVLNRIEQIKKELKELQGKLGDMEVCGEEERGLVKTIGNGKGKILDFVFANGIVDEEFKKALISSVNNALDKAKELEKEKKQEIIGNIQMPDIPGLF